MTEAKERKTIHCPKETEFILTLHNRRHFGQAKTENTPYTRPVMKTRFNGSASTRESELVLAGVYEEEDLDQLSRLFLDNLCRVTELDSQPALQKQFFAPRLLETRQE